MKVFSKEKYRSNGGVSSWANACDGQPVINECVKGKNGVVYSCSEGTQPLWCIDTDEKREEKKAFKKGDKVKVIMVSEHDAKRNMKIGDVYEVVSIRDDAVGVNALFCGDYYMGLDQIELVNEKNNMEKIAEMLGVRIGEEFDIVIGRETALSYIPYSITEKGLVDKDGDAHYNYLGYLLVGKCAIRKLPPKPKFTEKEIEIMKACLLLKYSGIKRDNKCSHQLWAFRNGADVFSLDVSFNDMFSFIKDKETFTLPDTL